MSGRTSSFCGIPGGTISITDAEVIESSH